MLRANDVEVRAGARLLLSPVSFQIIPGDRIGLVGRNGAGKTTLTKILSGEALPAAGKVTRSGTLGYLPQDPRSGDPEQIARDRILGARGFDHAAKRMQEAEAAMADGTASEREAAMAAYAKAENAFVAAGGYAAESEAARIASNLGLPDRVLTQPLKTLSGGQRRRIELARILFSNADTLLLDEPTNHLDAESVLWLEQHLQKYPGAVLAVTHDRYFLDHVAEWICEVDRGQLYPYKGNYSTYLETKAERLEVAGKKDAKLQKRLKDELKWVRSGAKARQAKNKARLERYEEMAAEAEKYKKLDFEEIQIPTPPRLGNQVVEVKNLNKGFDGRTLIKDLSFTLPRNGIVGVIGPNGVGKTTLFKTIVGLEEPDSGEVKVGQTVKLSYVDQNRENIDPDKTVWEVVSDGLDYIHVGQNEMPSRAYISAFGFKGPDQQKPAGVLSGGERNRLNLALTLKKGGNLILLDEPTNDLDVETLSSLENALTKFPGCAVVISHDRWFLDRTCTHILAWEGNFEEGKWFWFEGNFEDYEKNKVERLGPDAARPTAVHRKLTR